MKWVKQLGGIGEEKINCISTIDDKIIVGGSFKDTVDFDLGVGEHQLSSQGYENAFILILDENGDFIWVGANFGFHSEISSIAISDLTEVYTVGTFRGQVDFAPSSSDTSILTSASLTKQDIFVQKLDSLGNLIWVNRIGNAQDAWVHDVVKSNESIYFTGGYKGTLDFDPSSSSVMKSSLNNSYDHYLAKWTTSGQFQWVRTGGTNYTDYGLSLDVDLFGNIYQTG